MAMNDWYQRQFGERATFAMSIALGPDPHPSGDQELDATWGALELWAEARCLTRNVSESDGVNDAIRWNLLPILQWILEVGLRLVNEDPFPRFSRGIDVPDGCAWFDATLSPPVLTSEQEQRWFLRRSEWRHHHALRTAALDVSLPNVVFRRIGDSMEVSWDNERWPPPHPGLSFVEPRGRVLVEAKAVATVLKETVCEVTRALAARTKLPALLALAETADKVDADTRSWRWLIHRPTAKIVQDELPGLCGRLDAATAVNKSGLFVPHTPETHVLRLCRLESKADVEAVLSAAKLISEKSMSSML